jgi:hypothetical protein
MFGESFTMQNFICIVLQRKFFNYKLDLLLKTKCLYTNFNAKKSWAKDPREEGKVKKNISK